MHLPNNKIQEIFSGFREYYLYFSIWQMRDWRFTGSKSSPIKVGLTSIRPHVSSELPWVQVLLGNARGILPQKYYTITCWRSATSRQNILLTWRYSVNNRQIFGDQFSSERTWNIKNIWFKIAHVPSLTTCYTSQASDRLRLRILWESTLYLEGRYVHGRASLPHSSILNVCRIILQLAINPFAKIPKAVGFPTREPNMPRDVKS